MKFTRLFSLSVKHPSYPGGVCHDFAIEPTQCTQQQLANCRCLLKSGPGWVHVYSDGLLGPGKSDRCTFRLRLENPDFALFTDLSDYRFEFASVYTYTNALALARPATSGSLTRELRLLQQQERFDWEPSGDDAEREFKFTLGGRPLAGTLQDAQEIEDLRNFREFTIDGALAETRYNSAENSVQGTSPSNFGAITIGYYARPTPVRDLFAEAEIVGFDGATALGDFAISFTSTLRPLTPVARLSDT